MTPEKLQEFLQKSKLQKTLVAEMVKVPLWVLTKWSRGETSLSRRQQTALDDFCSEFVKNNKYMQD